MKNLLNLLPNFTWFFMSHFSLYKSFLSNYLILNTNLNKISCFLCIENFKNIDYFNFLLSYLNSWDTCKRSLISDKSACCTSISLSSYCILLLLQRSNNKNNNVILITCKKALMKLASLTAILAWFSNSSSAPYAMSPLRNKSDGLYLYIMCINNIIVQYYQ